MLQTTGAIRAILGFAAAIALSLMLAACAKDPVLADLAELDKLGRAVFETQTAEISEFNKKIGMARTNEEKAALLATLIAGLDSRTKELSAFKAGTPEVKKAADLLVGGLRLSVEGAKEASQALSKGDQAALSRAGEKIRGGQQTIREGQQEFARLVKEKGYKRS